MNRKWGGASPIMHSSQIEDPSCLGPYPKTLAVGDEQTMTFDAADEGPFYLSEEQCQQQKHD